MDIIMDLLQVTASKTENDETHVHVNILHHSIETRVDKARANY